MEETIQLLKNVMKREVEEKNLAGISLLVRKNGQELLYLQEGLADLEQQRSVSRDCIYRLYSQTKPVTAAAAMILMERGILDLAEPVSRYLKTFRSQKVSTPDGLVPVYPWREMNLHDLLCMTSGLVYPDISFEAGRAADEVFRELDERLYGDNPMTTMELAERLGQLPLAFQPGSSWRYGTSADIMGAVIEVASGMKFGEFLQKELFEPLGMKDTGFFVPEEKKHRLAGVYEALEENEDGEQTVLTAEQHAGKNGSSAAGAGNTGGFQRKKKLIPYTGNNLGIRNQMDKSPAFESGGAGLVSTLDDYAAFAQMLLNGGEYGGKQILSPGTVAFMTQGELMPHQQGAFDWGGMEGYSYSNFMRIMKNPSQAIFQSVKGEYGWDGWLGMYFLNIPSEKMTVLIGMQRKDAGTMPVSRKLKNIVISRLCK